MTIHTPHGDLFVEGLADGCARCEEHAAEPWLTMDNANLRRLWSGQLFTNTDRIAAARLRDHVAEAREILSRLGLYRTEAMR